MARHSRVFLGLALAFTAGNLAAQQPAPDTAATPAPAAEAPPPIDVPPPEPMIAPPLTEEEMAPAAPPQAQVTEKRVQDPTRRARYDVAVIQALDKVTAETLRFEAAVGRPVRWKGLVFTVRACERSAPDEAIDDSVAYLTIDSQPRTQPGRATPAVRQAFRGWMYASSPGLHPMQHATYDAWVISCRAAAPAKPAGPAR